MFTLILVLSAVQLLLLKHCIGMEATEQKLLEVRWLPLSQGRDLI